MVRTELNPEELLVGLASGVPARQYESYLALGNLRRNEEVDSVIEAFLKGHKGARSYVGRYLADLGTAHSLKHLWRLARDSEGGERKIYLEILTRVSTANLDKSDVLVEGLKESDLQLVAYCVDELSHSRTPRAVMPLAHLYERANSHIQYEILKTLEDIRDSRSLDVARKAVDSGEIIVVCQGLHLLRSLGTEKDARLAIDRLRHSDRKVREYACWNLSKERRPGALAPLLRLMAEDPEPDVRLAAAKALLAYEDKLTAKALLSTVSGDSSLQVRMVAAFSLASHLSPTTTAVLLEALDSKEKARRQSAIDHLALRGASAALKALTRLLNEDSDLGLRCGAAAALGHIGEPRSVPVLESHVRAELPLAYACAQSLCRIWGVHRFDELAGVLKKGGLGQDTLHVFASHIAKLSHVTSLPDSLLQQARHWLESDDEVLKYFGIDVLGRVGAHDDVDRLAALVPETRVQQPLEAWPSLKKLIFRHAPLFRDRLMDGWLPESQLFWTALSTGTMKTSDVEVWAKLVTDRYLTSPLPEESGKVGGDPGESFTTPVDSPAAEELIWPEDILPADPTDQGTPEQAVEDSGEERIDIGGLDVEVQERAPAASRGVMEFSDSEAPSVEPPPPVRKVVQWAIDRGSLRPLATLLNWFRDHGSLIPTLYQEGVMTPMQSAEALRRVSRSRVLSEGERRLLGDLLSRTEGGLLDILLQVVERSPAPEALGPLLDLSIKQSHQGAREVLGRMLGAADGL